MSTGTRLSTLLLLAFAPALSAQCELKQILPPGQVIEGIGRSVDAATQGIILGSYKDDRVGKDAGSMTPFQKNGVSWRHEVTQNASDPEPFAWFGYSVARTEDLIVSSAPRRSAPAGVQCGALYVFREDPLSGSVLEVFQEIKLVPPDITANSRLGWDIDIEGVTGGDELLAAGAPFHAHAGGPAGGAVYLYRTLTPGVWTLEAELVGGVAGAEFGSSVALSHGTLVVGAPGANGNVGEVHLFQQIAGTWTEVAVIPGNTGGVDQFGAVVDLRVGVSGLPDVLVVGAPLGDASGAADAGLVSTFELALPAWSPISVIAPPEPQAGAHFGGSVSISPFIPMIAVGAPLGVTTTGITGRVWLFKPTTDETSWEIKAEMPLTLPKDNGGFGAGLALWDDFVIVGAPQEQPDTKITGAVHALGGFIEKWVDLGFAKPGPTYAPALTATGVLCPNTTLHLHVTGGPPVAKAEIIIGVNDVYTIYKGGILVPFAGLVISQHIATNAAGELHYDFLYPPGGLHGKNFTTQVWIADASASEGWIATNGLKTFDP